VIAKYGGSRDRVRRFEVRRYAAITDVSPTVYANATQNYKYVKWSFC